MFLRRQLISYERITFATGFQRVCIWSSLKISYLKCRFSSVKNTEWHQSFCMQALFSRETVFLVWKVIFNFSLKSSSFENPIFI